MLARLGDHLRLEEQREVVATVVGGGKRCLVLWVGEVGGWRAALHLEVEIGEEATWGFAFERS